MPKSSPDTALILAHVKATIGEMSGWTEWPGGWPDDIEAALVDAVFSARAIYRSSRGRGIHANVVAWRQSRDRNVYTLDAMMSEIDAIGISAWAHTFGNHQQSPRRPASAPGGSLKAATVRQAAGELRQHDVNQASQIDEFTTARAKRALRSVPGIGYATSNYFLILLGAPGVKPDRMIHRFLRNATGHGFSDAAAEQAISTVAEIIGAEPHELDHSIWKFESARA